MMEARVKYVDGLQFVGEASSGHALVMDGDTKFGGSNTAVRPTELLLIGLGGCSGMDVVSILKKKQQEVRGLEINIKGEKAETYPQRFTDITMEFVVTGSKISEEAVKRAVELSMEKYCSVKATIEGSAKITFSYRIVEV
ncbi:MAG TPA: OsmC family protein [Thermodesulfovibrionales bacterium]|jgi:putative redox protein|nr:OsmC family protein [Thermodesulfovibrionales bacterium]